MELSAVAACVFCLSLCSIRDAKAEIYSSTPNIESLIHTEAMLIDQLEDVERQLISMHEMIHNHIIGLRRKKNSRTSIEQQLMTSHPTMIFMYISHLVTESEAITSFLQRNGFQESLAKLNDLLTGEKFPKAEDVTGIARAIYQLQSTYHIIPDTFSDGNVPGLPTSLALSAVECFKIGVEHAKMALDLEEIGYFHSAARWLRIAVQRYDQQNHTLRSPKLQYILDWLFLANHRAGGNLLSTMEILEKLVSSDPNWDGAQSNLEFTKSQLSLLNKDELQKLEQENIQERSRFEFPEDDDSSAALCRSSSWTKTKIKSTDKCYLETHGNSFLLIQPVKVEVMNQDPEIYIFHDVLTSAQVEILKALATENLVRSKARTEDNPDAGIVVDSRISQSAKIPDGESTVGNRINKHSQIIANLHVDSSEPLMVSNYAVGGFFDTHVDYLRGVNPGEENDRLATMIYYLSDVDAGGATVFPLLDVTLIPKKGSAAFWFNLKTNGQGDIRTRHSGCPVLYGTKWLAHRIFLEANADQQSSMSASKRY